MYTEEDYIQNRVDNQINWYDIKSQKHQKWYKCYKRLEVILTASIPVLSLLAFHHSNIIIAIIAAAVLIFQSLNQLNKNHENYIEYRATCEALRHEKHLYLTGSAVYYNEEAPFNLFVRRVETIISNENINWATMQHDEVKKENIK